MPLTVDNVLCVIGCKCTHMVVSPSGMTGQVRPLRVQAIWRIISPPYCLKIFLWLLLEWTKYCHQSLLNWYQWFGRKYWRQKWALVRNTCHIPMAQNNIGWENIDIDDSSVKKWLKRVELWRSVRIILNSCCLCFAFMFILIIYDIYDYI